MKFIRRLYEFLVKVCQYIPILWHDRDWDYAYILILLQFKLKRTRECIIKNDIILESNLVAEEIKQCEDCIERILNDEYCKEEEENLESIDGAPKLDFTPTSDSNYQEMKIIYPKALSNEEARERRMELYLKQEKCKQEDYDLLFKMLREKIQGWWD